MIGHLKPYPAMKDSGVPWLGEVPGHWDIRRLRHVLVPVTERNRPDLPLLSVAREQGVIRRDTTSKGMNFNFIPDDLCNYKAVRAGQFAMNKMKAWQGSYGVSQHDGIVSPAYFVFDLRGVGRAFLHSAIRSRAYVPFFTQASAGVRTGQWDLSQARIKEIPFVVPPPPEQAAVVRFLDCIDRRIRRYLRAKQKLIKLLEEQKQAIIHRAVTRGLDPNVRLKPSGVEWLGEVPEHWEVLPLRRRWTVTDCKHLTVPFVEEGIPLASVREVQSFDLDLTQAKRTTADWHANLVTGNRRPKKGDLIYCRNVSVGAAAYVGTDERFAMGQDVCLIRSNKENQRFLNYFLHSPAMKAQLALLLVGSTFDRINVSGINRLIVAVPPRHEQDEIAALLDGVLKSCHRLMAHAHRQISLLREYRTRLFADVVTGKLDVREVAARLAADPQEPEEHESIDEVDALTDKEEETEVVSDADEFGEMGMVHDHND